mmetsp:Transcript_21582/g.35692  ORF Transcript_21582/g.35692 Transcript_21582/m.35692 type:complete len:94 (-) Transcript_21582:172-453(-)
MIASRIATRSLSRVHTHQRRGIVDYLTKYPDKVMATKKIQMAGGTLQGQNNPTWLKQPGDFAVTGFGMLLVSFGLVQLGVGYYRLATGKGKKD